jgi:hypothetical protein
MAWYFIAITKVKIKGAKLALDKTSFSFSKIKNLSSIQVQ